MEENNRIAETWQLKNRAISIDNINLVSPSVDNLQIAPGTFDNSNKENKDQNEQAPMINIPVSDDDINSNQYNKGDEVDNIIPWRAQLRKTNSRLSLI